MKNKSLLFASFIFMLFVCCDSSTDDESKKTTNFLSLKSKSLRFGDLEKNTPNSSANGQGALYLDYPEFPLSVSGMQYFSFHSNTDNNGSVTGSFETKWGVNGRIHGTIDCLSILDDGKTAIMSGTITQVQGVTYIADGFVAGMSVWFKVQDNGEGVNKPEDKFSDFYSGFYFPICSLDFDVDLYTITNGNIQVKK